ncbi:MAG: hypothetical protein NTW55_04755 [Planctomycetota bacterium]|nr:hypothetical protein [Planctomycetota bacterium]
MKAREKKKSEHKLENIPTLSGRRRFWVKLLLPTFVFCWPVLYLFNHVFTIDGKYTAIGNDFINFYYKHKLYLLGCMDNFHLPLWSPAEAAGFPFFTNPFSQTFYPLNFLLLIWYKIFGGFSPLDYQVFTVIGISIFALGLFMWLRLLNTNLRAVLFAVLVMSVSFKTAEILRFPNAVHSAAWYPWILYALTKIMLPGSRKKALTAAAILVFSVTCLCTAGYPYYVFYVPFLIVPYMLVFLIKPLRMRLFGITSIPWRQALITLAAAGVVSILLCGPYLLGLQNLMTQTTDRTGKNFDYSTEHIFNFEDTVGSLVYPPASQSEGWYFFSITAILIIFLYLLRRNSAARAEQKDDQAPANLNDRWIKLFLIIWIAVITYITYGRNSYLFIFLWKYMPGFSALRVWGRLNIVLVPIIAWLLSLAYASFDYCISQKPEAKKNSQTWMPIVTTVAVYAVVIAVQLYLYRNKIYDTYWQQFFKNVSSKDATFLITGAAAFLAVLLIIIFSSRFRLKSNSSLITVLVILILAAIVEMRPVGANMWSYQSNAIPERFKLDVAQIDELSFRYARTDYESTISLRPNFSTSIVPNWYFNRYVKFLRETENQLEARRILLGVRDGTKIFFSESIEHVTVASFLNDAARCRNTGKLVSYNGDELIWEINAPVNGYFTFIDNWCPGWKVFVDDKPADMELLFGTFKSVGLSTGNHRVRFCYQPGLSDFLHPPSVPTSQATKLSDFKK